MIPLSYVQAWRHSAPWPELWQIEQDLIICRALCDVFLSDTLSGKVAFRGGTAIHKLLFKKPLRYSEDIDLVQLSSEPIGQTIDSIRETLSWLGSCNRKQAGHSTNLLFRFMPETGIETRLKVKIEINTREHESCYPIKAYPFAVENDWYSGKADILSYVPEELFATKLRALLQRRKNRDLFDLYEGLQQLNISKDRLLECFAYYLKMESISISRAEAEQRMLEKLTRNLIEDIAPLLPAGIQYKKQDAITAFNIVWSELIERLPGQAWKSTEEVVKRFQSSQFPELLS